MIRRRSCTGAPVRSCGDDDVRSAHPGGGLGRNGAELSIPSVVFLLAFLYNAAWDIAGTVWLASSEATCVCAGAGWLAGWLCLVASLRLMDWLCVADWRGVHVGGCRV